MKCLIVYSYGFEIEVKDKGEVEEIIRKKHLNVSLINAENDFIEVRSENYKHLWILMWELSNRMEWEIY